MPTISQTAAVAPPDASALPYVFVIGFNKTGTTSIHRFFQDNGFPSIHWAANKLAARMVENCVLGRRTLAGYDGKYRVFSDMMLHTRRFWFEGNSLFRSLDADYPGAYFLYNTRRMEDWLASRATHSSVTVGESLMEFSRRHLKTQDDQAVLDHWRRVRESFEVEVRAHFRDNPRFLELDIEDTEFAAKVSAFIGIPMDPVHWGQHNVTKERPS